jgi:hypothetical protein
MRDTISRNRSPGWSTPTSTHWFQIHVFPVPHCPWKVSSPSWCLSEPSEGHLSWVASGLFGMRRAVDPTLTDLVLNLLCSKVDSLVRCDVMCGSMFGDQTFYKFYIVETEKTNLYPEYLSIPIMMNLCPFQFKGIQCNKFATKCIFCLFKGCCAM